MIEEDQDKDTSRLDTPGKDFIEAVDESTFAESVAAPATAGNWLSPDEPSDVLAADSHEPIAFEPAFVPVAYIPETGEESVRQSGLAWSMGIVFFGSVAFMLFLGWLADWLLGSSPWGVVVGVVLGSIIGFIQFFRISSRIFKSKEPEHQPLLTREPDEKPPEF